MYEETIPQKEEQHINVAREMADAILQIPDPSQQNEMLKVIKDIVLISRQNKLEQLEKEAEYIRMIIQEF